MKLWIEQLKKLVCGIVLICMGLLTYNNTSGNIGSVAMIAGTVLIFWWAFE